MKNLGNVIKFFKKLSVCPYVFTVLLILLVLRSGMAFGAGGDLIWQDVFDLASGANVARAVTFRGNRVFVGGTGGQSQLTAAGVVRTYNAKTGEVLWDDVFDPGGGNTSVFDVAARKNRVFAVGGGDEVDNTSVWIVRAYNSKNGAIIWEDQLNEGGINAEARGATAVGNRVYVAGRGDNPDGNAEWLVRVYDSSTGDLIWQDRFEGTGKDHSARAITVLGNRVFVAGGAINPVTIGDWIVRAYDAADGKLLWEDTFGEEGGFFSALSIVARGDTVFAAGIGKTLMENDWIVRAYNASSGALQWEDRFNTGSGTGATSITTNRFGVFVTGGISSPTERAMIVKSYDSTNGDSLWEDEVNFDEFGGGIGGTSITVKGKRVYASGAGSINSVNTWIVRSYDGKSGALLWDDQFDLGANANDARAIATQRRRVYAVGSAIDIDAFRNQWVVRAYEAR